MSAMSNGNNVAVISNDIQVHSSTRWQLSGRSGRAITRNFQLGAKVVMTPRRYDLREHDAQLCVTFPQQLSIRRSVICVSDLGYSVCEISRVLDYGSPRTSRLSVRTCTRIVFTPMVIVEHVSVLYAPWNTR